MLKMEATLMKRSSSNSQGKAIWQPWLPHLLVIIWLLYLAAAIWQRALHSVQPPFFDPLSYMQKALSFWRAVGHGTFVNPFSLEPSVRPPGTILMSYPFGFTPDFRGFHFRSVFLPILCVVAAVYIVAGKVQAKTAGWWVAAMALLFSSLPMFYHFDWSDENYGPVGWGLVDNFQAGVAAMAVAALVRSLAARSQHWLLLGTLLASFTLLIKPSGLMVMALMALIWLMAVVFEWRRRSRLGLPISSLRTYVLKGGAGILVVYACVTALCAVAGYLSRRNFAFAQKVLAVWSKVSQASFEQTLLLFHQSSGEAPVLWVLGASALFICSIPAARECPSAMAKAQALLPGSVAIWGLGIWYWQAVQAGGNQIRYFFPFLLMGLVCVIPAALSVWPQANRTIRSLLMALCFAPALNIAALLAAGDSPSISWQKTTGVGVTVGGYQEEVRQAYSFLEELRKTKKDARVYSFLNGMGAQSFICVGIYERMIRPELPSFSIVGPMDWVSGFAFRVNELLDSDYILVMNDGPQEAAAWLGLTRIDPFLAEARVFEIWLSKLDERSGVKIVSDGRELRLLRISDRALIDRAIAEFVSTRSWQPEFVGANRPYQPVWWSADAVASHAKNLVAEEIGFEDVYKVHALSFERVNNEIKVEVWWEELRHEEANDQRYLFLHLVDSSGKILHNQQIALHPYQPPYENRRWRYASVTFDEVDRDAAFLAFGVYQPRGVFLMADKGRTDWDGRRVLVPL